MDHWDHLCQGVDDGTLYNHLIGQQGSPPLRLQPSCRAYIDHLLPLYSSKINICYVVLGTRFGP